MDPHADQTLDTVRRNKNRALFSKLIDTKDNRPDTTKTRGGQKAK